MQVTKLELGFDAYPQTAHEAARLSHLLVACLAALDRQAAYTHVSDEAPIFLASIGWRSGSTLLQRGLMTDPSVLIWGEPIEAKMLLNRFVEGLFIHSNRPGFWSSGKSFENLANEWVALFWPDPGDMKAALLAFLDRWFAVPAQRHGFATWGLKEVRWSGLDAIFLKWLYPKARFLLLVRDPVAAYTSLLRYGFKSGEADFWARWPDRPIIDAGDFARFWNALAVSWKVAQEFLEYKLVLYEDLIAGPAEIEVVGRQMGLTLNPESVLSYRINRSPLRKLSATNEENKTIVKITNDGKSLYM